MLSARRWILVLKPPRLRPIACDPFFWRLPPHAGVLGLSYYLQNAPTSLSHPLDPPHFGYAPALFARCLPCATDKTDSRHCAPAHTALASPATVSLSVRSTTFHSPSPDDHAPGVPSSLFALASVPRVVPTVDLLILRVSSLYFTALSFANTP